MGQKKLSTYRKKVNLPSGHRLKKQDSKRRKKKRSRKMGAKSQRRLKQQRLEGAFCLTQ